MDFTEGLPHPSRYGGPFLKLLGNTQRRSEGGGALCGDGNCTWLQSKDNKTFLSIGVNL